MRKYNNEVVVAVSDAFIGAENWYYFSELPEYHSVMLDIHMYQVKHLFDFKLNFFLQVSNTIVGIRR